MVRRQKFLDLNIINIREVLKQQDNTDEEEDYDGEIVLNTKFIEILEKSAELRLVTGIVLEPETEDGQGDIYNEDEIRKTAHEFMVNYLGQGNGIMHETYGHPELPIVESYLAPVDFKIGEQAVKKGTWLMTTLVLNDNIWKAVKAGEITGYSIRGRSNAKQESA
jgi:hypothetical protein